jgi:hypothetical protein
MNKRKFAIFGRDKERTTLKLQAETACLYHYEPAVKGKMVLEDVGSTWTDPHFHLCVLGIAICGLFQDHRARGLPTFFDLQLLGDQINDHPYIPSGNLT